MNYPEYESFIRAKMVAAPERGISIEPGDINPLLKPHQAPIVRWAVRKGNAAIFAAPSYNDFGHTETNEQFWEQMDFLMGII